ncbi:DIX domain-containing protein [Aphelenchoides avenae]|nr:DIX domain-containing protein [Aphelenchus avenae]
MVNENALKVYYYIDDSASPYLSIVPAANGHVTLGDFKKSFNKTGYDYFCKEYDKDIDRDVKVGITADEQVLQKSKNGIIELFLRSVNPPSSSGTLPRAVISKARAKEDAHTGKGRGLQKRRSLQAIPSLADESEILAAGGRRASALSKDYSISGTGSLSTFFSKRAGEQLAEYSASEDPYKYDDSTYTMDTSNYRQVSPGEGRSATVRQRKPRKARYRKPYVPSTISSATESSYSLPRVEEVQVRMQDAPFLGIKIASHDGGIFISKIEDGGAADRCGMLEVGDQIVQVDFTSFENLSDKECVAVLQKAAKSKRTITIYVAKRPRISDQRSDALSVLGETLQMDVSMWVETTKQVGVEPVKPFRDINTSVENVLDENANGAAVIHTHDETSDEERAAYMDRRNGVGACLVPALQNKMVTGELLNRHRENDENERVDKLVNTLTVDLDPLVILRQMARPDSGLQIKNRKWLKIPVPMSFIGDEMIDWLLKNVRGFRDRKAAKRYASMLLLKGYIKHVVNMSTFNEKCYYIFEDSIIAERLRLEQAKNGAAESHTEVTYVSSPPGVDAVNNGNGGPAVRPLNGVVVELGKSPYPHTAPPLPPRNNFYVPSTTNRPGAPERPMPGPAINQTWPFSPISVANGANGNLRRDCDTPVTNDYASMIHGEVNGGAQFIPSEAPTLPRPAQRFAVPPPPLPSQKVRSLSPPPPNTPNTLSGSSICLIPPPPNVQRKPLDR